MERILVDMDGVIADIYAQYLEYELRNGLKHEIKNLYGLLETEAFSRAYEYVNSEKFFINMPVMPEAQKILEELNNRYEVYIVSSATEYPNSLTQKMFWLMEHFPFISWKQVVLCGTKEVVKGDIMIDDHFKNLDYFNGKETFLFTQPHNFFADAGRHKRVDSWQEIAKYLL